ncbi:hypothetical protein ACOMHN_000146 [Nucella lapillus]
MEDLKLLSPPSLTEDLIQCCHHPFSRRTSNSAVTTLPHGGLQTVLSPPSLMEDLKQCCHHPLSQRTSNSAVTTLSHGGPQTVLTALPLPHEVPFFSSDPSSDLQF